MSKNHFLPFQINTIIFIFVWIFFTKWVPAAILDVRNSLSMAFLAISDHCKTFFFTFYTKWPPEPILDVRNSLLISFLTISDRYTTLFFLGNFNIMAAVGYFWCPKFTFDRISGHFRSMQNFLKLFYKMAADVHFGCPKFNFDRISGDFR